jgi:hypothetical protein
LLRRSGAWSNGSVLLRGLPNKAVPTEVGNHRDSAMNGGSFRIS